MKTNHWFLSLCLVVIIHAGYAQPWKEHGRLTVSEPGNVMVFEDGSPFFWLGSTDWALHQNLNKEDVIYYLDDVVKNQFNVIQLFTASAWAMTENGNYFGEKPYIDNDPVKLNPAYWDHLEWVIDEAAKRNLFVFLVYGVPGRKDEGLPFVTTAAQAYHYGYAVGTTLREKENIIWGNGIDVDPTDTTRVSSMGIAGWHAMAEGVSDGVNGIFQFDDKSDYTTTLMTYHPNWEHASSSWFADAPWLDFTGAQIGLQKPSSLIHDVITADAARKTKKPFINLEPYYEEIDWVQPHVNAWHMRLQAYQSIMAGARGFSYGHHAIFAFDAPMDRWGKVWRQKLGAPGRMQMKHVVRVANVFHSLEDVSSYPVIVSSQDNDHTNFSTERWISTISNSDKSRTVFYSPQGKWFEVESAAYTSRHEAHWFDVRTGDMLRCKPKRVSKRWRFIPPTSGTEADWILILKKQ